MELIWSLVVLSLNTVASASNPCSMCLLVYSGRLAKSALWSTRADNRTTPHRVHTDIKGHSSAFGRKHFFSFLLDFCDCSRMCGDWFLFRDTQAWSKSLKWVGNFEFSRKNTLIAFLIVTLLEEVVWSVGNSPWQRNSLEALYPHSELTNTDCWAQNGNTQGRDLPT